MCECCRVRQWVSQQASIRSGLLLPCGHFVNPPHPPPGNLNSRGGYYVQTSAHLVIFEWEILMKIMYIVQINILCRRGDREDLGYSGPHPRPHHKRVTSPSLHTPVSSLNTTHTCDTNYCSPYITSILLLIDASHL